MSKTSGSDIERRIMIAIFAFVAATAVFEFRTFAGV